MIEAETQGSPAPATALPDWPSDKLVEKFIALRDKVAEIKKRHTAELAPFHVAMATLEAGMLDALNKSGAHSMRTEAGTFYTTTLTSASVQQWSEVLDFIRTKEAWELLEARVNKTAAEAIMDETKQPIPGVKITRTVNLNVRRA